MKIKNIIKIKPVNTIISCELEGSTGSCNFDNGERIEISIYDGLAIEGINAIKKILYKLVEEESTLVSYDYKKLSEDSSKTISEFLYFQEINKRGLIIFLWEVELDFSDKIKKEQVSLTISTNVLLKLRHESEISKKSLSTIVDEKLKYLLGFKEPASDKRIEELISSIELLLTDFKLFSKRDVSSKKGNTNFFRLGQKL